MAFIKKPFKRLAEGGSAAEADTYIDLGELTFDGEGGALGEPVHEIVRVDAGDVPDLGGVGPAAAQRLRLAHGNSMVATSPAVASLAFVFGK